MLTFAFETFNMNPVNDRALEMKLTFRYDEVSVAKSVRYRSAVRLPKQSVYVFTFFVTAPSDLLESPFIPRE